MQEGHCIRNGPVGWDLWSSREASRADIVREHASTLGLSTRLNIVRTEYRTSLHGSKAKRDVVPHGQADSGGRSATPDPFLHVQSLERA